MRAAVRLLNETGSYEAVIYLTEEKVKRREVAWRVEHAVVVAMEAVYRFDEMKSQPAEVRRPLRKLTLSVPQRSDLTDGEAAAARGLAIAHGMDLARDLGNLPGNICTPAYLAERAQTLASELSFGCQVLERAAARGAEDGLVPVGDQRQRTTAEVHRSRIQRRGRKAEAGGPGRQGHHVRQRRHFAQARADMDQMKFDMCGRQQRAGHVPRDRRAEGQGEHGRLDRCLREHAERPRDQAGRYRAQHVRADDRGAQHRRGRSPDPLRRA